MRYADSTSTSDLVLAVDLGTTCFKAALFDRRGRLVSLGRIRVEKESEDGQRCELSVERFWHTLRQAIAQALKAAQVEAGAIRGFCYSSQANSFLLLDKAHRPLTPLILWPDRRAAEIPLDPGLQALWSRPDFLYTTGLGLHGAEFCAAKLAWFQRQEKELWQACSRVQTMSDYLVFSLTGVPVGDQGTAAMLGLWDLTAACWWSEALQAIRLRREQLSEPLPPGSLAGTTCPASTELLGIPAGIPVAVGSLDHHVAAIGAGVCSADAPTISIGTVVACVRYQERLAPLPGCASGPGTHGYPFYLLAFDENGTGALDRYQRENCRDLLFAEMLSAADSIPVGSDGVIACPALVGVRQSFRGVKSVHTEAHFVRALMEGTAASLFRMIERLHPDRLPKRVIATGGGARSTSWLRICADLSGIEFTVPGCAEAACLGAGMMAAVAAGWFSSLSEVPENWKPFDAVIHPQPERHARYLGWLNQYGAVKRRKRDERL